MKKEIFNSKTYKQDELKHPELLRNPEYIQKRNEFLKSNKPKKIKNDLFDSKTNLTNRDVFSKSKKINELF